MCLPPCLARACPLTAGCHARVQDLTTRYVSDEAGMEDAMRLAVGGLLRELLRGATDAMNRVKTECVPQPCLRDRHA